MIEQVFIVVNPYCHEGRGWKRWLRIKQPVLQAIPKPVTELVSEKGAALAALLQPAWQDAAGSCLVSAGGDGSLHALVNTLLASKHAHIPVGAIGLGSSNDFLKPFRSFIQQVPVRIDITKPYRLHDVGKAVYTDARNQRKETHFIVNASFGATAEGNWNFNHPRMLLRWLKKRATGLAISYTAISTILQFTNKQARIYFDGEEKQLSISNINLIKKPFISGSLHYTQPILPDDGRLGLHICTGMSRLELLQTLLQLEKGRFTQSNKRISRYTQTFRLSSQEPVVFECDGETDQATKVSISVVPKALTLLGA